MASYISHSIYLLIKFNKNYKSTYIIHNNIFMTKITKTSTVSTGTYINFYNHLVKINVFG